MDKISIIVPCFNAEKYICRCVDSLLNQDYDNYEVVIVNDGSVDDTLNILNKYKNNSKIKIISQKNSGVSVARNTGISNSSGDFICFVDADDFVEKNYLSSMIKYKGKNRLIVGKYDILSKNNHINNFIEYEGSIRYNYENIDKIYMLFEKCVINAPYCKLFDSRILKQNDILFDENMNFGEDLKFVLRYCEYVDDIYTFNEVIYSYVYNDDGLTHKISSKQVESFLLIKEYVLNLLIKKGWYVDKMKNFFINSFLDDYINFNLLGFQFNEYIDVYKFFKNNILVKKIKKEYFQERTHSFKKMLFLFFDYKFFWCFFSKLRVLKKKVIK